MIQFEKYRLLPQEVQAEILWMEGTYLELIRKKSGLNIELYALDNFYVEIYFDRINGEPLLLRSFNEMKDLDAYLGQIHIEGLFEAGNKSTL